MQSTLLAVFPEEQLKELRETEVTVLLENVGKIEVLSLTQSELRNTAKEVDWETIDETKSGFEQGLNSSFDCLPLLNLDTRLSIFGSFKQIFFEAELLWLGLLSFLFWIVDNNGTKWFDWSSADLTKVPNGSLRQKQYSEALLVNTTSSSSDVTIE